MLRELLGFPAVFMASVLRLATGCGTSALAQSVDQDARAPADGGNPEDSDISTSEKCGNTPTLLVDYVQDVPDAGRSAVETPDVAVNATDLYYVSNWSTPLTSASTGSRDGYLMRVPIRGGIAVRMAFIPGGGSPRPGGLAVTPTTVIFAQAGGSDGGEGAIMSLPAYGGSATVLATTKGVAQALVVDDKNVYFADAEATKSVPLTGGPVRTLATLVPLSLGVAGGTLYLADFTGDTVSSVPIDGGQVTVLANSQPGPLYPVTCGPNLCWVNAGLMRQGTLMQLAPGGPPVVLAGGFSKPHDLVFDGNNFFVTTGAGALWLYRVPSAGGTPMLVESEIGITNMTLDETCLYWASLRGISSLARRAADVAGSTDQ